MNASFASRPKTDTDQQAAGHGFVVEFVRAGSDIMMMCVNRAKIELRVLDL